MNKRLDYIDTAKGILIILVALGHYIQLLPMDAPLAQYPYFIKDFIYYFHMPAFIIISGMLSNPNKWNELGFMPFLKRKIIRIMIPYFVFEVLAGITRIILFHISIQDAIYNTFTMQCNLGSNWFIATLFFAEILFYFTHKLGKIINCFIAFICIFFMPDYAPLNGNLCIVILRIMIALAFINIGYFAKKIWQYNNNIIMWLCLLGLLFSSAFDIPMELWDVSITDPILYSVRALMGTYLVLNISRVKTSKFLSACGINSLGIMMTHHLFKYYIEVTGLVTSIPALIIAIVIGGMFVYLSILFLNKYFPIAVGKPFGQRIN